MPDTNSSNPRERCIIYGRVSDSKQSGTMAQLTNGRRLAREHDLEIVAEVEDDGVSGDDLERPGLLEVMAIIGRAHRQKAPVGWLIVDHSDRLSRADSLDTAEVLAKMRRLGVHKVATPSRIFNLYDAMDRTLLQIEADHKNNPHLKEQGRKVLNGMLDTARAGFWTGQKAPLGYKVVRNAGDHARRKRGEQDKRCRRTSGRLEIDPETAPLVRAIFERYNNGESSTRELARWLGSQTGRSWTHQGIQHMLERELYAGTRTFGKVATGRHVHVQDGVAVIKKPDEEAGSVTPDVVRLSGWPAIIEPELFAAVQQKLRNGRSNAQHKDAAIVPLSGLCKCGLCGAPMHSHRQGPYPYLRCSRRQHDPVHCPMSVHMRGDEVLRRVLAILSEKLLAGDTVARLVELAGQAEDEARATWEAEVDAAGRAVQGCTTRLATARRRLAEAPDDMVEEYQRLIRELREEMAAAEAELARLRAQQPGAQSGDADLLARWLEHCREMCQGDTAADCATQNAVLRELIAEVSVFPPERTIRGKKTVGRVEVTLPEWLSCVLSRTASRRSARTTGGWAGRSSRPRPSGSSPSGARRGRRGFPSSAAGPESGAAGAPASSARGPRSASRTSRRTPGASPGAP